MTKDSDDDLAKKIGARLRTLRETTDMNILQFADFIEIESARWNAYELGRRMLPPAVARIVKRRTAVTLEWLYDGDPSSLPPRLFHTLVPPNEKTEEAMRIHEIYRSGHLSDAEARLIYGLLAQASNSIAAASERIGIMMDNRHAQENELETEGGVWRSTFVADDEQSKAKSHRLIHGPAMPVTASSAAAARKKKS